MEPRTDEQLKTPESRQEARPRRFHLVRLEERFRILQLEERINPSGVKDVWGGPVFGSC
jgi:hypothetical protein